jgi:hypothetical protein
MRHVVRMALRPWDTLVINHSTHFTVCTVLIAPWGQLRAEGKSADIHTDIRYVFGLVHDLVTLLKHRDFLSSSGKHWYTKGFTNDPKSVCGACEICANINVGRWISNHRFRWISSNSSRVWLVSIIKGFLTSRAGAGCGSQSPKSGSPTEIGAYQQNERQQWLTLF